MLVTESYDRTDPALTVQNTIIERVRSYQCLGTKLEDTNSNDRPSEVKRQTGIARTAFVKMKILLVNPHLNLS